MPTITLKNETLHVVVNPDQGMSIVACFAKKATSWLPIMPDTRSKDSDLECASFLMVPYSVKINNRTTIGWNSAPDSNRRNEETILQYAIEKMEPGSIISMHLWYSSRIQSLNALPRIIHYYKENGYRFVKLSEVL